LTKPARFEARLTIRVMAPNDDAASLEVEKWKVGARKSYGSTLARTEGSNALSFPTLAWRTTF
jgi:hypothetical protein